MELSVLYGFTIFLLTISLMKHVRAAAIDIPLISKLNAPLKAELDISILTTQLKELIGNEVKQAVSEAMKDLAENIVDNKTQSAVENLQTSNNLTISTLLKEIEVAMTAHTLTNIISNTIMKFDDVKYSVGITNLPTYKTTGKLTCEHEGLYLISASVISSTNDAHYYIRLNERDISYTFIGQHSATNKAFTGAVTVTRKLNPNDQVWLYAAGSWYLYCGLWSILTIIKIK